MPFAIDTLNNRFPPSQLVSNQIAIFKTGVAGLASWREPVTDFPLLKLFLTKPSYR
jgi:hypothetical protein